MTSTQLVSFARLLRDNGVRVSPAEVADAARALSLVPLSDPAAVRGSLRATLVKRGRDAAAFDRIFALHFGAAGRLFEGVAESLEGALSFEGLTAAEREAVIRAVTGAGPATPLARALLDGRSDQVATLLRRAADSVDFSRMGSPLQQGFFARRVLSRAHAGEARSLLGGIGQALRERGLDDEAIAAVEERLHERLRAIEQLAQRITEDAARSRDRESTSGEDALLHRAFARLTREDLERVRAIVRRLAERLKVRIVRKRRHRRRGQLHVRRTLRANLALGGLPARLSFRQRRPQRPEIVILCDVSDSVRNASRLMLQLMHGLQSAYSRVRSFVFVSEVGEVTEAFRRASVDEAVDGAITSRTIDLSANSNYGHALATFLREHGEAVTRRTTLIVLGDGRTNHNPSGAWALEELSRKARRVLWLCTEDREAWGFGDSAMPSYARHCARVHVVRTVDELSSAVESLFP